MHLTSSNGNSVTLCLDGYEFPATAGSGERDYDANWLYVEGQVVNGPLTWSFRDPCLTTWDGRALAGWLRSVADGSLRPEPSDPNGEGGGLLVFTEPNLAFNLHERTSEWATIRVYLSLESLPESVEPEIFEYFVELEMSNDSVHESATEWEVEIRQFPVRA